MARAMLENMAGSFTLKSRPSSLHKLTLAFCTMVVSATSGLSFSPRRLPKFENYVLQTTAWQKTIVAFCSTIYLPADLLLMRLNVKGKTKQEYQENHIILLCSFFGRRRLKKIVIKANNFCSNQLSV